MMSRTPFLFTLAVLGLASSLRAQEPAAESLQFQLDYQTQRAKLLSTRIQLMKESQEIEVNQAKLRNETTKAERESRQNQIKASEAQMQAIKLNLDRTEQLHERGVTTELALEKARQEWMRAELEYKNALAAAKHTEHERSLGELELKRLELQVAIQVNAVQLELLEAEFRIKELKLALQRS